MRIKILKGIASANKSIGLTVVIDVFRAFSTSCFLIESGATAIIPVDSIEKAIKLKEENPTYVLCGERNGYKPEGFDYGNSPSEIKDIKLNNKIVVLATTLGTQGLMKAEKANEIITGSFLNIDATVKYILKKNPKDVSLLCTGTNSLDSDDEDYLCAKLIESKLKNIPVDFNLLIKELISNGYANYFFDSEIKSHPKEDFYLCTQLNKFNFILKAENNKSKQIRINKYEEN
ncbi:MAG: 2-phosphosulfolactate phosphatase [Patescibacteria group bacterium]